MPLGRAALVRARLLEPVERTYGEAGLELVERLADGRPGNVTPGLVAVAIGILARPPQQ